ncbi:MAG: adenylyltransferase/cytidyltransferase family protein [Candidatus Woesearchaeota archaeon]
MKKVLVFGTFNIIHPGHLNLFRQALSYGDRLYVVLARDTTVKTFKKYTPYTELERKKKLEQLPMIHKVVLGDQKDRMSCISLIKPDVICLGYDQRFFIDELKQFLEESGLHIPIIRLKEYHADKYKSSKFVSKETTM